MQEGEGVSSPNLYQCSPKFTYAKLKLELAKHLTPHAYGEFLSQLLTFTFLPSSVKILLAAWSINKESVSGVCS